jgi:hypothetical protein
MEVTVKWLAGPETQGLVTCNRGPAISGDRREDM